MFSKFHSLLSLCIIFQILYSCTAVYRPTQINKKVNVTVYFESLCPSCHKFIKLQLVPTWNLMRDYMILDLVPYGNAEREFVNGHWIFTCQHGELECIENLMDACAVQLLQDKNTTKLIQFINCMSINKNVRFAEKANLCVRQEKIPINKMKSCLLSPDTEELMLNIAKKTEGAYIDGTPTIEIDGVYDENEEYEITNNFKKVICIHLGDPQPDVCNKLSTYRWM